MDTGSQSTNGVQLVEVANGRSFPAAPGSSTILSSVPRGWRGIVVEWHKLEPQELPEHYVEGYGITVHLGRAPIPFGWKDGDKRIEGVMNPGDFHLLTRGEPNAPRWSGVFDEVSFVLEPGYAAGWPATACRRVRWSSPRNARLSMPPSRGMPKPSEKS